MSYSYFYSDGDAAVTAGANGNITYGGVIQRPDGHGGYNVSFNITGSLAYYHVHFARGGTRVEVVRYFSGAGGEGNNIMRRNGTAQTLSNLAHECGGFPNHQALLNNIKNACAGVPRTPSQELA